MMAEPLRLRQLLERLTEAEIHFVLVGGLAVNAWGYLRATRDVDVVPDPSGENLTKLDSLLKELGGKVDVGGRLLDSTPRHLLSISRDSPSEFAPLITCAR